jgi:hypothetical protein
VLYLDATLAGLFVAIVVMRYEEFFRERQEARYAVSKGRFRGCCRSK